MGVVPYKIQVSEDGELFAVDEVNSNIVKITPPLSQCMEPLVPFFFEFVNFKLCTNVRNAAANMILKFMFP